MRNDESRGAASIADRVALATRVVALATTSFALACATSWDPSFSARYDALLEPIGKHRLRDTTPYLYAKPGHLTFFLCRFSTENPITVALPADATAKEQEILGSVLHAWEEAGLGVRFQRVRGREAAVTLRFVDGAARGPAGVASGNTIADCRVDLAASDFAAGGAVVAELVSSRVSLSRRTPPDFRNQDRALSPEEIAGIALHEMGHALGFSGHTKGGATVMRREPGEITRVGRRVLAGEPFADSTLEALYALPSGVVVRRVEVPTLRTKVAERADRLAERFALDGPFVRSGDLQARIFWRTVRQSEYGIQVVNLQETLRHPERVAFVPESRMQAALVRELD